MSWSIDDAEIRSYITSEYSDIEIIAPIFGGISAIVVFIIIHNNGWFSYLPFYFGKHKTIVDQGVGAFVGIAVTAFIFFIIASFLHPKKNI